MKNSWKLFENEWVDLIYSNLVFLKKTEKKTVHHTHAKRALNRLLRAWTDYPPKYVSKKALLLFEEAGKSPKDTSRKDSLMFGRVEYGKDGERKGKSKIVFEHTTPINEFIDHLLTLDSINQIKDAMNRYSGVCWVTREEDNLLNEKKCRSNRNGKWEKCYNDYKITINKIK